MPKRDGTPTQREQRIEAGVISDIERNVLAYIQRYVSSHGYPPTYRDIQERFGWKSANTPFYVIGRLIGKGYLRRGRNYRSRTLKVIKRIPIEPEPHEPEEVVTEPYSKESGRDRLVAILKRQKLVPDDLNVTLDGANKLRVRWPGSRSVFVVHVQEVERT